MGTKGPASQVLYGAGGAQTALQTPNRLRGRGDLSAAMTTSLSHPSCRGRRVLALPGRGTRCVIKQRTKQTLWSVPLNVSPRRAWVWGGLRTSGAAELRTWPVSAQLRSRVTPWRRRGSDASGSSSSSPAGAQSQRGALGGRGGRGAPPSPPCLTPHPGRSARRRRGIDRPEPELSARSDTISFPLSGSIASTGFQFVFPEIHLPDTFLINPFPHTRDAHRSSTPGPVCGPGTTRLEPLGAAGVFKAAGSPFPHCGPQCQPGGGLGPPTQREPRTREVWAVARAPCRASIL